MDLAKEMTKEALPIKCLEAVILGMYPYSKRPGRGQTTCSAPLGSLPSLEGVGCMCSKALPALSPSSLELGPKVEEHWGVGVGGWFVPHLRC